jgi:hypothetical protein
LFFCRRGLGIGGGFVLPGLLGSWASWFFEEGMGLMRARRLIVALVSVCSLVGCLFWVSGALADSFSLPDGRLWELVSPAQKHGALIMPIGYGAIQASEDGGAFTFVANNPMGSGISGNTTLSQLYSVRGVDGWSTRDISPSHNTSTSVGLPEYRVFSGDLSVGLVEPLGETLLSGASEKTPYSFDASSGVFTPIVSAGNVPVGAAFGSTIDFLGASPDARHVVFGSRVGLTAPNPGENGPDNLYEWSGGTLSLVSVLPNGKSAVMEGLAPRLGGWFGNDEASFRAVSADGSRVFWSGGPDSLFMTDPATEQTVKIEAPGGGGGEFESASVDGSRVFFLDERGRLDVYEAASGTASVVAPTGPTGFGLEASEDGSYVYFIDPSYRLYAAHEVNGVWSTVFIATLSAKDASDWGFGQLKDVLGNTPNPSYVSSQVSPDGRFFTFMSTESLTGYDNRDLASGQSVTEVFLYDAVSDRLVCASCNPNGARPSGIFDEGDEFAILGQEETGENQRLLVDPLGIWGSVWLGGSLPTWTAFDTFAYRQPRYLSNGGRLFFNSHDALTDQASNGVEDVYEYEPGGVGSCVQAGGCIGLISAGVSPEESAFLDASSSGDDVFFLTAERLTSEDADDGYDVYDAHVCSALLPCFSQPVSPPACNNGDSCKNAPSPQPLVFGPAPTATFSGTGNLPDTVSGSGAKRPSSVSDKKNKARKKRRRRQRSGSGRGSSKGRKARRSAHARNSMSGMARH